MVGSQQLADWFLANGLERGETSILLTTDTAAGPAAERVAAATRIDDVLTRLGVVDATGQPTAESGAYGAESAGSPADLTGIGIAFQRLAERMVTDYSAEPHVVFDSLSTLTAYNELDRVYQFTNTMTNFVDQMGGTGLFLIRDDAKDEKAASLQGLFDGRIDLRDAANGVEYRLSGVGDDDGWHGFELPTAPKRQPEPTGSEFRAGTPLIETPIDSLHALIEEMAATGFTLVICNYTGDDATLAELEAYFARLNVSVTTAALSTELPTDVALLHRGSEPLAVSSVQDLTSAVRLAELESIDPEALDITRPDVLKHAHRQQYTVENGGKFELIRISRLIETRALNVGGGTLHAGFQRLDRVDDEQGTRKLYERLAESGVSVNIYGTPAAVPREELYTVHAGEDAELADSWFVVFDSDDAASQAGALVSEETEAGRYSGFWSFQTALVDAVDDYLGQTYPVDA